MAFPTAVVTPGSGLTINTLPDAGQLTMANSLSVTMASNQSTFPTTSLSSAAITNPTSTLTRPANTTAYTANDLIASSTTAGSIVVPSFAIATSAGGAILPRIRLRTNATANWGGVQLSINLWTAAPTFTNGDNGVYVVATGSLGWVANFQITLVQFGDGAVGAAQLAGASQMALDLAAGTSVFWDVQTLTTVTPISLQTFILTAELLN